jgi:hypothetical protein
MKSTLETPGLFILLSLISFISCIKKPVDPPVVTTMLLPVPILIKAMDYLFDVLRIDNFLSY